MDTSIISNRNNQSTPKQSFGFIATSNATHFNIYKGKSNEVIPVNCVYCTEYNFNCKHQAKLCSLLQANMEKVSNQNRMSAWGPQLSQLVKLKDITACHAGHQTMTKHNYYYYCLQVSKGHNIMEEV